jgi:DNA-binding response OmpR family regulator
MTRVPTILISDDEPELASALRREVNRAGMSAVIDANSDVVAMAKEHQPDLIVLDIHQRIDGRDLLAALKNDPQTKHLKVLMLSAVEDQFMRHTCLELGAADYDVKPFDPGFIRRMIRLVDDGLRAAA